MGTNGKYRIIDQQPRESGGTTIRYISAYGGEFTLETMKKDPEEIRRHIEKSEALRRRDRNRPARSADDEAISPNDYGITWEDQMGMSHGAVIELAKKRKREQEQREQKAGKDG